MDLLAEILARPVPSRITGTGEWRIFDRHEQFEFEVDHEREKWVVRNLTSGSVTSFSNGVLVRDGREMSSPYYRDQVTAPPLQLLIPERLPVWGRPGDFFDPVSREPFGADAELVTVQRRGETSNRNTLVLDRKIAIVTRYHDTYAVTSVAIKRVDEPFMDKPFDLDRRRASGARL